MNEDSGPIPEHVLKDIKEHLGFMFERGYEIYSVNDYPNAGWPVREVILKREDLFVKIYEERGELELSFGSPSHGYINVGSIIYFLSGGKEIIGDFAGMKKYAKLIQQYVDEIESGCRDDYSRFTEDIRSAREKYDELVQKSIPWPVWLIVYGFLFIVCFNLYDELVIGWLLSDLLLNYGYSFPSVLTKVVSFLLAAGTVYVIDQALKKSENAVKNVVVYTEPRQRPKRNLILLAIILFPVYLLFFAIIISLALSAWSLDTANDSFYSIATWAVSLLLSLWVARAIIKSKKHE